jgi:hypothetical protein
MFETTIALTHPVRIWDDIIGAVWESATIWTVDLLIEI